MATAEELLLKVTADTASAERKMTGLANHVDGKAKAMGKSMADAGKKMTVGLTLPIIGVGVKAVKAFTTQEDATKKLTSAFDSTGAAAWTTVEALQANADKLQQLTTHGDESIETMQSVLLTFTNIKGDVFDGATMSILNMSDALGMDLQSSATMVGKALNDPVGGIAAMSRAGIQFTDEQKETIKTLVEMGDTVGAQTIILGELENQFGGTAEAMAETSSGQMKQAMNTLGDSMETVGAIIIPMLVSVTDFIGKMAQKFDALSPSAQKGIVAFLGIVAAIGPVLLIVGKLIQLGGMLSKAIRGVGIAMNFLAANPIVLIIVAIVALIAAIVLIIKNWDEVKAFLLKTWQQITDFFEPWIAKIQEVWETVWGAISDFFMAIWEAVKEWFAGQIKAIKDTITAVLGAIKAAWEWYWNFIVNFYKGIWKAIVETLRTAVKTVKDVISGVITTVSRMWETFTEGISSTWSKIWDTLSDGIQTAMTGAWNIIKGAINWIITGLESGINNVIDLLNAAIKAYNSIPLAPDIGLIPKVSVPRLAEGGMVNNAGPVRVGERGIEVINLPKGATVTPGGNAGGFSINIERMEGGNPKDMAQEIGWEFSKRGIA